MWKWLRTWTARNWWRRVGRLKARAEGAEAVLFYFSGHGAGIDTVNYLMPIDAKPVDEALVNVHNDGMKLEAVVVPLLGIRNATKIVIIDACRSLPKFVATGAAKSNGWRGGLAAPRDPPDDLIVAFATEEGATASDRRSEANGAYAQGLLKAWLDPTSTWPRCWSRPPAKPGASPTVSRTPSLMGWTSPNTSSGSCYHHPVKPVELPSWKKRIAGCGSKPPESHHGR